MASPLRSLVKSISYRLTGSIVTGSVIWLATGQGDLALGAGIGEVFVKLGLYYVHERLWDHITWGRQP